MGFYLLGYGFAYGDYKCAAAPRTRAPLSGAGPRESLPFVTRAEAARTRTRNSIESDGKMTYAGNGFIGHRFFAMSRARPPAACHVTLLLFAEAASGTTACAEARFPAARAPRRAAVRQGPVAVLQLVRPWRSASRKPRARAPHRAAAQPPPGFLARVDPRRRARAPPRFFQYTFAATASTIVSGSVIERAKISAYITYSLYLTAFVYPVVAHWEWSASGWLSANRVTGKILFNSGIVDFAGCGAVHMVGGFSGIVGAYMVGPRLGRYNADGSVNPMPGHNVPFAALGTLVLWFGWYGFNCGSAGALIGKSDVISRVAMSTTLGGAAGGIAALCYAIFINGVWDVTMTMNGILAGLVSITSGCAFFEPWAAVVAGGIGGVIFPAASSLLTRIRIDDPLEAGAMHGGCGMWGLFATGLLAQTKAVNAVNEDPVTGIAPLRPGGGFYARGELLAAQIVGIVTIAGWVCANMLMCFSLLRFFRLLRIPADEEHAGMDESYHGGSAYPGMEPAANTVIYDLSTVGGNAFVAAQVDAPNGGNGDAKPTE